MTKYILTEEQIVKNLNRNFIGIELDKKYFEIVKERICEES